jgi:hypothetical protein
MHRRSIAIALAPGLVLGACLLVAGAVKRSPIEARCVRVETLGSPGNKAVTIELKRRHPDGQRTEFWLTGGIKIQLRIRNSWTQPQAVPQKDIVLDEKAEFILIAVPVETEACRLNANYRVYYKTRNPYCKMSSRLWRLGLTRRCPRLSRAILKCYESRIKSTSLEVMLSAKESAQFSAN